MPRELIKLVSTAGTGHFYTTTKTTKGVSTGKLEMKKYDPKARKHVNYRESKMK